MPYFHVVYTLPAPIADIAYQNKPVIYGLLPAVPERGWHITPASEKPAPDRKLLLSLQQSLRPRQPTEKPTMETCKAESAQTKAAILIKRPRDCRSVIYSQDHNGRIGLLWVSGR